MLALVVARPGPVCDGLVALLGAAHNISKITQVARPEDAWDFVQSICPHITIIYASPFADMADLTPRMKAFCQRPILAIVTSEEDGRTAVAQGADIVVMEGLPSSKLAAHISTLTEASLSSAAPISDK